jgi:hypothetical protein
MKGMRKSAFALMLVYAATLALAYGAGSGTIADRRDGAAEIGAAGDLAVNVKRFAQHEATGAQSDTTGRPASDELASPPSTAGGASAGVPSTAPGQDGDAPTQTDNGDRAGGDGSAGRRTDGTGGGPRR